MTDPEVPITTHDCGAFVIDIPSAWQGVRGSEGVHAWAEPELVEHVIVGGYHLAETVDAAERATLIDVLVQDELDELARLGEGKVVVRRSVRHGDNAVLSIVTGVDGAHDLVFAYYFVITTSTVVKLKYQRLGRERSEREVLIQAASVAVSLKIREIVSG